MFVVGGTKEPSEYLHLQIFVRSFDARPQPDPNGGRQNILQVVTAVQQLCSKIEQF